MENMELYIVDVGVKHCWDEVNTYSMDTHIVTSYERALEIINNIQKKRTVFAAFIYTTQFSNRELIRDENIETIVKLDPLNHRITSMRLDEIATKAIHKLLEIDELAAKEFFVDDLDITEEEINYFEIDWYGEIE